MVLNVITLVMVLAIIFMHSIFGLFSGLINVFCSIFSMAVAFGFYEALNRFITGQFSLHPAYTEPICLIGLFIVTMIIVRTLADNYIRGNVRVPMVLDWGGAAVCGFINAQIFVGMLILSVQMLPLRNPTTGTVLGYATFSRAPEERDAEHPRLADFERNHVWTRSDEFTVGLFNILSGGSLRGETAFASVYPDFTEAIFYSTNTVQRESTPAPYRWERGREQDGFEKGLSVEQWWEQQGRFTEEARYRKEIPTARITTPGYETVPFETAPGKKLVGTELVLHPSAADRDSRTAAHLFRPTMLRLVGSVRGDPEHAVARMIANVDPNLRGKHRIVDLDNNLRVSGQGEAKIYAYFEVDQDFEPDFVEYRRHARAPVIAASLAEAPPEIELTLAAALDRAEDRQGRGKRTFGRALMHDSGDTPRLPFKMARSALRRSGDAKLEGNKFAAGRIFGTVKRLEHSGSGAAVEEFKLPEGKRLMQVRYKPKEARTLVGDVFNYVAQVNQYFIRDKFGDRYPLAGYFAIVKRGQDEYIELFYAGGPDEETSAAFRGMLDFKQLERNEINDQEDSVICLLFLVPPDRRFDRVQNQAGDGGDISLKSNPLW